ncbi:MAG: hypothetical protein WCD79_01950 [Chthoniobacteraceae bacterium]
MRDEVQLRREEGKSGQKLTVGRLKFRLVRVRIKRIPALVVATILLMTGFGGHRAFCEPAAPVSDKEKDELAADEIYRNDEERYNAIWVTLLEQKSQDVKDFKKMYSQVEMRVPGPYVGHPRNGNRHTLTLRAEWRAGYFVFLYIPFTAGLDKRTIVWIEPPYELFIEPPDLSKQRTFRKGDWWGVLKKHGGDLESLKGVKDEAQWGE